MSFCATIKKPPQNSKKPVCTESTFLYVRLRKHKRFKRIGDGSNRGYEKYIDIKKLFCFFFFFLFLSQCLSFLSLCFSDLLFPPTDLSVYSSFSKSSVPLFHLPVFFLFLVLLELCTLYDSRISSPPPAKFSLHAKLPVLVPQN